MSIGRFTPCQKIVIWQPRWKDRKVLIAKFKVGAHNEITFTKTPTMQETYYLSGETIRKYPLESNGKVACYAVPIDELEVLERV